VSRLSHPLVQVGGAALLTIGWVAVLLLGVDLGVLATVGISGLAVLGASFLLAWGAETAEKDVPRAFAIAVLAVLAVAPEYAVDALYAWNAGAGGATAEACSQLTAAQIEASQTTLARGCHDANLAIANMTGANRILIGIGWAGIAVFTVWRAATTRDPAVENREGTLADAVTLDRDIATEIAFLFLATGWAFLVPLGGGIGLLDTLFLVGLYVTYIGLVLKSDVETSDHTVGVPKYFQKWSLPWRPLVVVTKARSTAGFNALISSKLNQWTLLIGTIAVVYSIALGGLGTLPFDQKQAAEIWITAAQSYFALAILVNFEITIREAIVLFGLFISQVLIEFALIRDLLVLPFGSYELLVGYTVLYLVIGTALFAVRRRALARLFGLAGDAFRTALGREPVHAEQAD